MYGYGQQEDDDDQIKCGVRGQPTAPQAIVVYSAAADTTLHRMRRTQPTGDRVYPLGPAENFSMMKGELAFSMSTPSLAAASFNPSYEDVPTFTAFDGISKNDVPYVRFMGVVAKGWQHDQASGDVAVTIQRAGTATILNTSETTIHQGSLVMWTPPSEPMETQYGKIPRVRGHFPSKYYPRIREYSTNEFMQIAIPSRNAKPEEERELKAAQEKLGREFLLFMPGHEEKMTEDYMIAFAMGFAHSKIIGRALSTAKPGQRIDILLGYFY